MITPLSFHNINNDKSEKKENSNFFRKFLFTISIKFLIVGILFLLSLIYVKQSSENKEKYKEMVYNNSLSFAKIYNIYNKYLGDVIPFKNIFKDNTKLVSNEKLSYEKIEKENDGYILSVSSDYTVSAIKSGIVTSVTKNNTYKNIITIQDKEGLNITYGLLEEVSVKLYDYVEKGELLGKSNKKLYLIFKKDDKYLSYEEYI